MQQQQQSIQVHVRVRPLLRNEAGQDIIIQTQGDHIMIQQTTQTITQEFDRVFPPTSSQADVFKSIEPSLAQSLKGYNTSVLAYGQTGSGKTHSMFGSDWEYQANVTIGHQSTCIEDLQSDVNHAGIIPRSVYSLFKLLPPDHVVYCSFLQVYNERIFDLLQDHKIPQPLQIHESKLDGVYVESLTEYAVNNFHDCLTLMRRGERNRVIRQTTMNLKSSRSHTIFQLLIESNKAFNGILSKSKVNLCDLAGSEKINKSEQMNNAHLMELKSINQSLTTLGKVIQNLSENNKKNNKLPVPYRESKLTRLLQDSLGGNTLTHIIVNVAPNIYNLDETVSSLKFAQRARNIAVKVVANKINATDQELVNKLMKEIDYYKGILNMKRNGLNNDIHFKLMKMQEENERLRVGSVTVSEVERLLIENRKMKEELQRFQTEGVSDTSQQLLKYTQEDGFTDSDNKFQRNAMFIVSNPMMELPKTEVTVRFKVRGNKMETKRGYVEQSDDQIKKEQRMRSERRRVIERLEYLEQLQRKHNQINNSVPLPNQNYSIQNTMSTRLPKLNRTLIPRPPQDSRLQIIEKQLIL